MKKVSDKEKWKILSESQSSGAGEQQKKEFEEIGRAYLVETVEQLSSDYAADFLRNFDEATRQQILSELSPEKAKKIQEILSYSPSATGSAMSKEYMAVPQEFTVGEAIESLQQLPVADRGRAPYVYIVKKEGEPTGVLKTQDLIFNAKTTLVKEIMKSPLDVITADEPQSKAARLLQEKKYLALPVVDSQKKLRGVVSASNVIQMIKDQADRDIAKMVGTGAEEMKSPSVLRILRLRMPWLFFSMASGLICAFISGVFDLDALAVLFLFVPVVLGLSESIGIQGATIVVRNLTMGKFSLKDLKGLFLKEISVGILIGLICGFLVGSAAMFWKQSWILGLAISTSMNVAITVSALVGLILPLIFKALRVDPAIASGPLVLALCDIQTLMIYFNLASRFLHPA